VKFLGPAHKSVEHILGAPPSELERLRGGRNNRVIRAGHPELGSIIIKHYFRDSYDSVARLKREWNYLEHLKQNKVQDVPLPLFKDTENGYAIYSNMKGVKLSSSLITKDHVKSAAKHIAILSQTSTGAIRPAKGMQSTLSGHIDDVHQRMVQLRKAANKNNKDLAFPKFLNECLEPLWAKRQIEAEEANTNKYFEAINFKLSPSDFGFHNILSDQNKLSFIDFEYAGTDDLAKLATDFILAPAIPIDKEQSQMFCKYLMKYANIDRYFFKRVSVLYPIAQVKWICIILNDFIEAESARKDFAGLSRKSKRLKQQIAIACLRYSDAIEKDAKI
jgi:thiamine kinase-like enzyme